MADRDKAPASEGERCWRNERTGFYEPCAGRPLPDETKPGTTPVVYVVTRAPSPSSAGAPAGEARTESEAGKRGGYVPPQPEAAGTTEALALVDAAMHAVEDNYTGDDKADSPWTSMFLRLSRIRATLAAPASPEAAGTPAGESYRAQPKEARKGHTGPPSLVGEHGGASPAQPEAPEGRFRAAICASVLESLAQNDYMIDGEYLPDGEQLLAIAAMLRGGKL